MREEKAKEHEYVLGTDADELRRLGFQHQVWSGEATKGWEGAGFAPGQALLDVGCGPGYATFDLVRLVGPEGRVHGIDVSERFINYLKGQIRGRGVNNVTVELCDVEQLQVPPGSFDGAYARWLLCFVSSPEKVVRAVSSALKRGGSFLVQDYCHYEGVTIAPPHAIFDRIFAAVSHSWRSRGGDPNVASRVPSMMVEAGFEIQSVRSISRIARPGSALWQWPATFFQNYLPDLLKAGLLSAEEKQEFEQEWTKRSSDPGAFFSSPPMAEIIGIKR